MQIVVGLGNPGPEYEGTRHNLGFRVIDVLADQFDIAVDRRLPRGVWGRGALGGTEVVLGRPSSFVNLSGASLLEMLGTFTSDAAELIVVHDDLDLGVGEIRVKRGGSGGGHRGIESIINRLGTDSFGRVRIGIGRPPGRQDPADFVLRRFGKHELEIVDEAVERAGDAVVAIVREGLPEAMNRFNRGARLEPPVD
ncbi:MAG: aminoacyl-tRNA hydrolase [Terriglobia bacterium]